MTNLPDKDSLQSQLAEARENLRLIQERMAKYVLSTDIPLQLVKEERHWIDKIADLERQLASQPTAPADYDHRRAYLERVLRECSRLRLLGLDTAAGHADVAEGEDIVLESVYVHLGTRRSVAEDEAIAGKGGRQDETKKGAEAAGGMGLLDWTRAPDEAEPTRLLTALEAAARWPRLTLTGGPGSGKSTFANYLILCLAAGGLPADARPFPLDGKLDLPGWPEELRPLPVRVTLRDFARQLPAGTERGTAAQLWAYIEGQMAPLQFGPLLRQALEDGRALVILDGLDEVAEQVAGRPVSPRRLVLQAVEDFAGRAFPRSRYLVTCRQASYVPPWTLRDFEEAPLDEFDEAKRDQFCVLWYAELARRGQLDAGHVPTKVAGLQGAIRRPDLARMAGNPLLLTVMTLVHAREPELPEARALLYEKCVDVLLWLWERRIADEARPPDLLTLLEQGRVDRTVFVRALNRLAYEVHVEGGARPGGADIRTSALIAQLAQLHPAHDLNWARQVVTFIRERAGLLVERRADEVDPVLAFPHHTFQEYLAACWLTEEEDTAAKAAELARQGDHWWEVVKLAAGRLLYVKSKKTQPLLMLDFLCPEWAGDDPAYWQLGQLAGEVLLELKSEEMVRDATIGGQVAARVERVRSRLAEALRQDNLLSARQRADAGNVLAQLPGPVPRSGVRGDPRFRANAWYLPNEPLLGFVEIPAGPFVMGEGKEQHVVDLPVYYIARYPVTAAQFRVFVQSSSYHVKGPWARYSGPDNHPVVAVTWYDAMAYCNWLTKQLKDWEGTPGALARLLQEGGWVVRLPSEAEWEKAARGGLPSSFEGEEIRGRVYPWGDNSDSNRANYKGTGIGTTSAVGCFPGGASPYGVEDMSGNVREWTLTLWGKWTELPNFIYPYDPKDGRENTEAGREFLRVLQGGAFDYFAKAVRCAYRRGRYADSWDSSIGFRIVLAPCVESS